MEGYEKRSAEAESQADKLEGEGDRVERHIEEVKSDVQSKQGMPGMETDEHAGDPAEATDEGEEPSTTSVD